MKNYLELRRNIIINKKGGINYEQLKDVARRTISGNATIERLNTEEERGRSKGGERAIEATLVIGGLQKAEGKSKEKLITEQKLLEEETILREYTEHKGVFFNENFFLKV